MEPANSFFKFLLGFLVLISLSLGITYAVNSYTLARDEQKQTAVAFQALVEHK